MRTAHAFNASYLGTATYSESSLAVERVFASRLTDESEDDPIEQAIATMIDADHSIEISESTKRSARLLLQVFWDRPAPDITIEPSGEIALEWYKDRHHVAVLSVSETSIRWAAMIGANNPISGVHVFEDDAEVPQEALNAVDAAT